MFRQASQSHKVLGILCASLLLWCGGASAGDGRSRELESFGGYPSIFLTCVAHAFGGADEPDRQFHSLESHGHWARFEFLLINSSAPFLTMRSRYSYFDPQIKKTSVTQRILPMSRLDAVQRRVPTYLNQMGLERPQMEELRARSKNIFVDLGGNPNPRKPFPNQRFYQYAFFPNGFRDVGLEKIPVEIKIAQHSGHAVQGEFMPVWSKVYLASCDGEYLRESEHYEKHLEYERILHYGEEDEAIQRQALAPALGAFLASVSLYSEEGELLAGKPVASLGTAALVSLAAVRILRSIISSVGKNPLLASVVLPEAGPARLTISLKAIGLSADEARNILSAPADQQRALCELLPQYARFCAVLTNLDQELAYAEGKAL